ncbi:MAG: FecR domain-containing protein [Candidatus Promineifilaceae bacterium]
MQAGRRPCYPGDCLLTCLVRPAKLGRIPEEVIPMHSHKIEHRQPRMNRASAFRPAWGLLALLLGLLLLTACAEGGNPFLALAAGEPLISAAEGEVSLKPADGGDDWSATRQGQAISAGDSLRTGPAGRAWLTFGGDSRLFLGPDTEVTIRALESSSEPKRRMVRLEQRRGETRHVVAEEEDADVLYEVTTPAAVIVADDAVFSIWLPAAAEGEAASARVTVSQGLALSQSGGQSYPLSAGKTLLLSAGQTPPIANFLVFGQGTVTQMGGVWIVAGRSFSVHAGTAIPAGIEVGDEVYVQGHLTPEGELVADRIIPLPAALLLPALAERDDFDLPAELEAGQECVTVVAAAADVGEDHIVLHNGTRLDLAEAEEIEGEVAPLSLLRITTCLRDGQPVTTIRVLEPAEDDERDDSGEDKALLCHIPPGNPANAHTISVGEAAVSAHLAHGDIAGACDLDPLDEADDAADDRDDVDAEDDANENGGDDDEDNAGAGQAQVTLCHRPPGNPANAHTISVGEAAVSAHLAHGDIAGAC